MTFRARPPAKLNLTLSVGPRGEDGYHPLRSVFARLALADELTVTLAPAASVDELVVGGPVSCPVEGNLVLRALALLRGAVGQSLPPLRVELLKRIPLGAGLAGGSSDGAAALELARRAWGLGLSPALAGALEAQLGSDVPFFAGGASLALVEGRGQLVRPLRGLVGAPPTGVLLSVAEPGLSTAAVYRRFDERAALDGRAASAATDRLIEAINGGLDSAGLIELAPQLRDANDLWPAATDLAPELAGRRSELERLTGRPWLMTGSGPTLFALYASAEQAEAAAGELGPELPASTAGSRFIATALDAAEARSEP